MKRYETYKETKLQWVNNIPNHWIEGKVKYLFDIGRGRVISQQELNPNGRYPVYSSQTKNDGCLGHIDTFDFDDDILTWTTDGANAGEVFKRNGKFNCTNVCGTLKPKKELNLVYFLYLMKFLTPFYKRPDTNGAKIMNGEMAEIISYFPSLVEQTQIAAYLDYKTGLIDSIIAQKEELIKKLKEQRQAIISEAVTKGLNKDVKLKDSGIEWLGEIPEHWEVVKLRYLSDITTGDKDTENREDDAKYPFFVRSQTIERISSYSFDGEAILTAGDGVGVCKVWHYINGKFDYHQRVYMMHNFRKVSGIYLFNFMKENFINEVLKLSAKSTVDSLRRPMFLDFPIAVPPMDEQSSIIDVLINKQKLIDNSIEEIISSIKKLKEYRQSLISEAVTGKVDVRDWQAPKS